MSNLNSITLLLLSFIMTSCATTPSQDSDFTVHGEEMEGPGLFSGDSGEIVFFEENKKTTTPGEGNNDESGALSRPSQADWQEFSEFKRWLKSKQAQDDSYQEFQQWLKYEEYRRLQDSL